MPKHHGFPEPRERPVSVESSLANIFDEYQTSGGFVTLGDATADILAFSGTPDSIEVMVETFDAILIFGRRGVAEEEEITIRAGQSFEPGVRADRVRGRNAAPGSNASVQVMGRWLKARSMHRGKEAEVAT